MTWACSRCTSDPGLAPGSRGWWISVTSVSHEQWTRPITTPYQLVLQRDLVELELVNLSRGSAQQHRSCQQGERLHDGQRE